jgi:SET domain
MKVLHGLPRARHEANGASIRDFAHNLQKLRKCQHLYLAETADRGLGVFAARAFSPGDTVMMDFDGDYYEQVLSYEELRQSNITLKYPLQVGPDLFRLPSGTIDDFINHSCQPNTGIRLYARGAVILAIRPIETHDEITFDYSTYLNNPYEQITCRCGSENCRGVIGNFTTLPNDSQQRYLELRIVGDFVLGGQAVDDALA